MQTSKKPHQLRSLFVIELLLPLIVKVAIIYECIHFLNWIPGIIGYYLILLVYRWFLFKYYGLLPIDGSDKIFITEKAEQRYQILSYMQFETFNAKEFKEIIIQKMLTLYSKFRMKLSHKFLEHWWHEVSVEEAINKISILQRMKDEDEVMNHMKEELNIQIDIFESLPYEFQLIPFGDNKGVVLLKFDHLMSDGLGLISFLCKSASNYTPEIFPKLMQNIPKEQWYIILLHWLIFPFVLLYDLFVLFSFSIRSNPLRVNKEASKGKSVFASSKSYQIRSFDNYKKRYGLSFNDVMMTAISLALSKLKQLDTEKFAAWTKANIFLPVGRKALPRSSNEVRLDNDFSVAFCNVPLIDNPVKPKTVQEAVWKYFRRPIQFCHSKTLVLFGGLLTWRLMRYFTKIVIQRFDLVFTNVPGPVTPLNYDGFICEKMLAFPAAGHAIPFLPLISYNHSFSFSIVLDQGSEVKPEYFIERIEEALDEIQSH